MDKFAPIHIISGYSLLQSALTMKKIDSALKDNDYFGMGLTDFDVLSGLAPFYHLMNDANKPYVLGVTINVDNDFLVLYATNEEGYRNLIGISLEVQKEALTLDYLKEHNEGLICAIETKYGHFYETFSSLEKVDTTFTKYLLNIYNTFPDRFYLGIEITSKEENIYAKKVRQFAEQYTYKCVALPRVLYYKKEDAIALKIVQAIAISDTLEENKCIGQNYFMVESDYHKIYTPEEIKNTNVIVNSNKVDFSIKRGKLLHYNCENSDEELSRMVYESLAKHGLDNNQMYIDRLEYELGIIKKMGFSDYFLIVQDYVSYAKSHDILVGPGRGSSAGSLIAYLLDITEANPLEYHLIFERFLNPNRSTMPDIDVDFMDTKKDEVIQYMREKYGNEKVCIITTFQTIGAKQAIRDIGRIYSISEDHISKLTKAIGDDAVSLGYAYKNYQTFQKLCNSDEFFRGIVSLAGKIEGLPRQSSQHAAGVILNDFDISSVMPISLDINDNYISQYEAKYLEEQGFLKMDFLSLRNLTTISKCVDLINAHYPDLHFSKNHIPYDTKEIFELIRSLHVKGLFQIETSMMRKGIKTLKPSCFEDIVALLELNRPGPIMHLSTYAKRRDGLEKYTFISKDLEEILSSTYGIIVFQEQINQIAISMAGMSPGEADLFRRAISKKDSKTINASKERFINGSIEKGYSKKDAENIFSQIAKFDQYGFNRSHAVVYAMLTCRMAYLKANYPLEFYAAILQTGSSKSTKISDYILEMQESNMKVSAPDINLSGLEYDVVNDVLLFPLTVIKGLNSLMVNKILEEREKGPFKSFFDFILRMFAHNISEDQVLVLINAGCLDSLYNSRASLRATIKSAMQYAMLNQGEDGQLDLGISLIAPPSIIVEEDNPIDNLTRQYDVLDVFLSDNPLTYRQEELTNLGVKKIDELDKKMGKIAGIVREVKKFNTAKGEQMASVSIYEQTKLINVTVFPRVYDVCKGLLVKNRILIIEGKIDNYRDDEIFVAETITALED